MIHFLNTWRHNERGQAAVEAAFIIPILLLLLFGIFVVGYWMYALQVVNSAAREGARVGAQTGNPRLAEMAARNAMKVIDTYIVIRLLLTIVLVLFIVGILYLNGLFFP